MFNKNKEPKLGDQVRDTVTGFTGIVIGVTEWLNGCGRVHVKRQELVNGKTVDSEVFDIVQLEVVKSGMIKHEKSKTKTPNLGDLAKEKITGFKGVVTYVTHWLSGDITVGLQPQDLNNGAIVDAQTCANSMIEVIEKDVIESKVKRPGQKENTGGPCDDKKTQIKMKF